MAHGPDEHGAEHAPEATVPPMAPAAEVLHAGAHPELAETHVPAAEVPHAHDVHDVEPPHIPAAPHTASRTKLSDRPFLGIVPRFFGRLWDGTKTIFRGTIVEPVSTSFNAAKNIVAATTLVPITGVLKNIGEEALVNEAVKNTYGNLKGSISKIVGGVRGAVSSIFKEAPKKLVSGWNIFKNLWLAGKALTYDPAARFLKESVYEGVWKKAIVGEVKTILNTSGKTISGALATAGDVLKKVLVDTPDTLISGTRKAIETTLEGSMQLVTSPFGEAAA